MAHDVFISHSSKDKTAADIVVAALESHGIRCWVAPRDIRPGMDWSKAIVEAIRDARLMVLIFSSNANDSQQIRREVERAVNRAVPVVPLRIENVTPTESLEYFISASHWLDAFAPPLESHLQYLANVVSEILKGSGATSSTVASPSMLTNPTVEMPRDEQRPKKRGFTITLSFTFCAFILFAGWWLGSHQFVNTHPTTSSIEEEVKEALRNQIERTIAEKKAFAEHAAKGSNLVSPDVFTALGDLNHIYPVSKKIAGLRAEDDESAGFLTPGDMLKLKKGQVIPRNADENTFVTMVVMTSKGDDDSVPAGTKIKVSIKDLQEFDSEFRAKIDLGLSKAGNGWDEFKKDKIQ